jgi:Pretoxin HINT domain
MDPYAYVGGNPETYTDPTGMRYAPPPPSGGVSQTDLEAYVYRYATSSKLGGSGLPALLDMWLYNRNAWVLAESYAVNYLHTSTMLLLGMEAFKLIHTAGINWNANVAMEELFIKLNSLARSYSASLEAGSGISDSPFANLDALSATISESANVLKGDLHVNVDENGDVNANGSGCPFSFTSMTAVTTDHGKQAIGTLQVGERVLAYNPKTHKMELEPILHVWINRDHDLVDLTITTTIKGEQGKPTTKTSEVIHTNQKHPFFTMEHGFLPVGQIKQGMHLLRADGRVGVVTGWKVVPGTKVMYNLEVAQDHTFTVGTGQWVVHNCAMPRDITNTSEMDPNAPGQLNNAGVIPGGGRSGGNRPLYGPPDSYIQSTGGHAFVYDDQGRLIYDIDSNRVKMTIWDQAPNGNFYPRDVKLAGPVPPEWLALLPSP